VTLDRCCCHLIRPSATFYLGRRNWLKIKAQSDLEKAETLSDRFTMFLFYIIAGNPPLSIQVHHGRDGLDCSFLMLKGCGKLDDDIITIGNAGQ